MIFFLWNENLALYLQSNGAKKFREIEFHEFSPVYNLVLRGDQKTPSHLFPSIVPDFALVQCLFLRKIPTYYFKIAFLKLLGM